MAAGTDDKRGEELKAQRFQMLADIAEELKGDVTFPTSFDVALRLRKLLNDPQADFRQVATVVGAEPLISSKLLRMANSVAVNAAGRAIRDLETAMARLGTKAVRGAVLGLALKQIMLSREMVCFQPFMAKLWEHSLRTAAAARVVARQFTRINPSEAMLTGLTHDLGAFYLLYRAAQYEELRVRPDTVRHLVIQWHESIGETLLYALGVDEESVQAAQNHDRPGPLPESPRTLADVIYVGNRLAGGHCGLADAAPESPIAGEGADEVYRALEPDIEASVLEVRAAFAS
jgi:HD-like signal output (HDOD) protein